MKFDWQGLKQAVVAQMVGAIEQVRTQHPTETVYGVMVHEFYGEAGGVVYWPNLTVGTEESLASAIAAYELRWPAERPKDDDHGLRWSGPDLSHGFDPGPEQDAWAQRFTAAAGTLGDDGAWEAAYERFLNTFARAAKLARTRLVQEGHVTNDFLAIAQDEGGELIQLSLTPAQLRRHFPQYDAAERERQRIAAMPLPAQIAELVPPAVSRHYKGALMGEYEDLVVALGVSAVPALVEVVRRPGPRDRIRALIMLARINEATPSAVSALCAVMRDAGAGINERAWAASALSRLDQMALVAQHLSELPREVAARGLADPYRSFRDGGKHPPLNYRPLETTLALHPGIEAAVAEELAPGRGLCTLAPHELAAARIGLASPWAVVRDHARRVLDEA